MTGAPPSPERRRLKPTPLERWLERRFPPYGFGVVFVLLFLTFVLLSLGPTDAVARAGTVILESTTLLVTLVAARTGRIIFRVATVVAIAAVVTAVASVSVDLSDQANGWFWALNVLLVAGAPVAIGYALFRRDAVDLHTVMGAICIYLLIGILYAFLYAAVGNISSEPFFVQEANPSLPTALYYSFVTQTTVGYGDYSTATNLGHTLSITEALLGQLYLVTVIAVLVSRLTPRRPPESE